MLFCLFISGSGLHARHGGGDVSAGAGRWFLPEAVSSRMRRRRCFADTELDAATLDCERAHAMLARQTAAVAVPQQPVVFRLPVSPYQLPSSGQTRGRPDEVATSLIGLVRACWTRPPTAILQSSGCQPAGQPSTVDVCGILSRLQPPPVVSGLAYARSSPTLGGSRRTIAARREARRHGRVEDQPHGSSSASTGRCHLHVTRTHTDSNEERRRLESNALRKAKTFNFSVESLLAR